MNTRWVNKFFFSIVLNHFVNYPTPSNLNYFWGLGSISGVLLVSQVISGLFLAMHYSPEIHIAYLSIEHIMRDVPNGWLVRYTHTNGASLFFIFVYIHISRAFYFKSYRKWVLWYSGLVIFLLMMASAFLGYVLPWGQMSLWGATVITNLFSAIPIVGEHIVVWLWGGFSVDNPTLKRFFVLHFILPLIIVSLTMLHIIILHDKGSTNPLAVCTKQDVVKFYPYFVTKDILGFLSLVGFLSILTIFFYPNLLGHPDNYIKADPLITPKHIVPEWYFLPFYAILRSIPNKLGGVVAMFLAIIILFLLPLLARYKMNSNKLCKIYQCFFWSFVFNFIFLGIIGARVVEYPYVIVGQLATGIYFFYFLVIIPLLSHLESYLWCRLHEMSQS